MITSPENPLIKEYSRLVHSRRYRRTARKLAVEGPNLLEQALAAGLVPEAVLYTPGFGCGKGHLLLSSLPEGVPQFQVSGALFAKIAATETPQEIAALIPYREPDLTGILSSQPSLALLLDRLQDPGNMGTILRTAASAGVEAVFYTPGSADPFSPKVLRSTAGALFHIPLAQVREPLELILTLQRLGLQVVAARPCSDLHFWCADFRSQTLLLIGNEKTGLSADLSAAADLAVNIPLTGTQDSLNAAVAAGILIYEVIRQRSGRREEGSFAGNTAPATALPAAEEMSP